MQHHACGIVTARGFVRHKKPFISHGRWRPDTYHQDRVIFFQRRHGYVKHKNTIAARKQPYYFEQNYRYRYQVQCAYTTDLQILTRIG